MDGHLEISPCVLQDIGPLGPLPCSHSTFWAAAPKGQCPVEHRGEFQDVRPFVWPEGAYFRLYRADFPFEGIFEGWRAELKLGEQI